MVGFQRKTYTDLFTYVFGWFISIMEYVNKKKRKTFEQKPDSTKRVYKSGGGVRVKTIYRQRTS